VYTSEIVIVTCSHELWVYKWSVNRGTNPNPVYSHCVTSQYEQSPRRQPGSSCQPSVRPSSEALESRDILFIKINLNIILPSTPVYPKLCFPFMFPNYNFICSSNLQGVIRQKCSVFWNITSCSRSKVNRRFGRTRNLNFQD
jgi:hypothetical protein